jgi:16S rRNA (guanine527-N7)-methyltransferase
MAPTAVQRRLSELADRFGLRPSAPRQLELLLDLVAVEPVSISAVRNPAVGVDVHVADSLVGLDLEAVRAASRVADLGSGGGFPGLVLAVALPGAHVSLVESVGRKCAFLDRAAAAMALDNVSVIPGRAEEWAAGIGSNDLVTARALAPLPVLVEYAAPLLEIGGVLVAWKGRREPAEEADAAAAAAVLAMDSPVAHEVDAFPGAGKRHLYLSLKVGSTPNGYPRRAGMARKRPLGASTGR